MIEVLKRQISALNNQNEKINKLREFLQIMALKNIYDKKAFNNIAFVGGTALRIIFEINRFSEDLDFSVINKKGYDFIKITDNIAKFFQKNNIAVESSPKTKGNIHSVFFKFPNILRDLNLAVSKNQKLSVKLEVDTNPPSGWQTDIFPINKTYLFSITAFDLPSMFATKLHACFFRKYTKGRDFYDLIWYLSKKIRPNIELLNNAIFQTERKNFKITESDISQFLSDRLDKVDFNAAKKDVLKFLFNYEETELINKKFIKNLISKNLFPEK
ncbi:MAG: nucleotidyl transferase AbiEii/AbiGii toxin family protein [Endomicrobium sp.]|jgi:predicted nucleotidyltransferase component of viral defense system|nr:nucleotidyl transferase AbiEii/AbiGii toxin family protein [Endomicrobium sp.]